ncbi:MAG: AAA family ATPase [Alphaproteobacteria bacterium]|nr:AAA family ATPase [Alphaproteobacteria bacterium]
MVELRSWLESLELGGYYETFIENRIDSDVLHDLSESDLRKLRIPLGDRKRLLRAIRKISSEEGRGDSLASAQIETVQAFHAGETDPNAAFQGQGEQLRHLTTMFVDLVGSSALAERLDIEDYWKMINAYRLCCAGVIRDFHGFVAQYLGDGVLAYFGYPRAAEDDAERAVSAGLEVVRSVGSIENELDIELEARVGVATGRVLISDLAEGHTDIKSTALGGTPHLAARLQAVAEPGSVAISDMTRVLLGNQFECVNIGNLSLKDFSEPMPVWHVRDVRFAASRFESRQKGPITPLSGRDVEFAALMKRWRSATEGEGRAVLISGEAGIGKSRLVQSLYGHIKNERHIRLRYQCSPFYARSALYPVISQLVHAAGINAKQSDQQKLDRLEDLLSRAIDDVPRVAPLFAHLLSIAHGGRYRPLEGSAEATREATTSALLEQLFGLEKSQPLVLVFEDIHWIDPSTEELLGRLVEQIETRRILLVCTYRLEFEALWAGQPGVSNIHLSRLDHRSSVEMVQELCGEHALSSEIAEAIAGKAEGVPLFIEELTRAVLEADGDAAGQETTTGVKHAAPLTLPSTLNELLMAKLDSLPGSEEAVTLCAAIGRTFSYGLLATVSGLPDDRLRMILDTLIRAQILTQRGRFPEATYAFRHALIQEAAYSTMLMSRARSLHANIANKLVTRMADYAASNPEVVAHHYGQAAMPKEACEYLAKAADLAAERSAYVEAIAHLEAALEENAKLADPHERIENEIALREKLVIPLEPFWGSDDVASNFRRLHELQSEHGDDKDLFAVLDGLYGTHVIGGKPDLALDYALNMAEIAEGQDDPAYSLISQHAIGMCHFGLADFDQAIAHFDAAMRLRPRASQDVMNQIYLADVEIIDLCMQSWARVLSGQKALAQQEIERARTMAEAVDHDFSQAYGFSILASSYQAMGDEAACLDHAARALELSRQKLFHYWAAWSEIMHGWATAASGDLDPGIDELRRGLDGYVKTGSRQIVLYAKSLLADLYLRAGRIRSGLALIEEIEAAERRLSVRFHRPIADRVARDLRDAFTSADMGPKA